MGALPGDVRRVARGGMTRVMTGLGPSSITTMGTGCEVGEGVCVGGGVGAATDRPARYNPFE